ncbi:MAG TPA: hypothetical protein DIT34_04985 [Acinetobacter ursingii]|uniref:Uncharacterized protein n=1 Tax=Acinetobacter ursingii TaxID=108980 RepID=A0A3D2SIN5_9GAMM|nr:hypothetical protein [Acinetobacter ursingii]HCO07663.1 hypothetical protein [Acinetobacter ursingii]
MRGLHVQFTFVDNFYAPTITLFYFLQCSKKINKCNENEILVMFFENMHNKYCKNTQKRPQKCSLYEEKMRI